MHENKYYSKRLLLRVNDNDNSEIIMNGNHEVFFQLKKHLVIPIHKHVSDIVISNVFTKIFLQINMSVVH